MGQVPEYPNRVGPGWFPDPWGVAPYRWWDGESWAASVWPSEQTPRATGRNAVRVVLIVSSAFFWVWAGLLVLILPLLFVNDADNGRLNHDLTFVWLPEIAVALAGAVVCLVMLGVERKRPRLWKVLIPPAVAIVALVVTTVVVRLVSG
jgi:hypothetical protein